MADYAPQPGDIVGVGGDTPQYAVEFAADGDYLGDAGFNSAGAYNRLVVFNATADGNGRQGYLQASTEASPLPLDPTDVLRAGEFPVQRISSSGSALKALVADTAENINFIFSASLPSPAQQSSAVSSGWGGLDVVQIATDNVGIAAATNSNAPAGLSIAELLQIYEGNYTTWNEIPGNGSGSTATIDPLLPPSTSSVYSTFIADLTVANGGTAPTLETGIQTVEQNDPTAIVPENSSGTLGTPNNNAIVPFSVGRLKLWTAGYFHNPFAAYPGSSTALKTGVSILSGATPDSGAVYNSPITDYVIFRADDAGISTPMEPGGSRNWVQTLFYNPGGSEPFFEKAAGQALITASGATASYSFLGTAET
jgi:hypothetical protein